MNRDKNLKLFPGITTLDHDPDVMLRLAVGQLTEVVIIGYDEAGELFISASKADGGDILWLLEQAKRALMDICG